MQHSLFITGIGTDVGKTIVSAVLTEALQADYWKPLQSGYEDGKDKDTVERLISNPKTKIYDSILELKLPASPNIAADGEGVRITVKEMIFPTTENLLLIEGAGGLMVPINEQETYLDFAKQNDLNTILVVRDYLGCINHTLLTLQVMKQHQVKIAFGVFNGVFSSAVENTIRGLSDCEWVKMEELVVLDKKNVLKEANRLKNELSRYR